MRSCIKEEKRTIIIWDYKVTYKWRTGKKEDSDTGYLGAFPDVMHIGPLDIEKYKRRRVEEVSPATVNRELSGLRNIYNRAIEWKMAAKNPMKAVKFFRESEGRLRFLEKEEIKKLYNTCPNYLKSIVALAICTGTRKEEILG